jgi:GNAT superfamily N-acetyltransferase
MKLSPTIRTLPKSHPNPQTWTRLIAQQKSFRLNALQTSPDSFSSTYAREAAFADSEWEARLQNPFALSLIAVKERTREFSETETSRDDVQTWIESEWQGSAVVFGPVSMDGVEIIKETLLFEIFGLFVLPSVRGRGVGTQLVQSAVEYAILQAAEKFERREIVVRVRITAGNPNALELYEKLGFSVVQAEEMGVVMEMRHKVMNSSDS